MRIRGQLAVRGAAVAESDGKRGASVDIKGIVFVMYLCAQFGFLVGVLMMSLLQVGHDD